MAPTVALLRDASRFLAQAVLILLGLATIGTFVPAIPGLGELGPILTSNFGPWIAVVSLVGAVAVLRRWRGNRSARTLTIGVLATIAAIGTIYVQARQIGVARANGIDIDLAQAFLAGSQADDHARPITVMVGAEAGEKLPLDLYRPTTPQGDRPAPVFVYIHGGGWGAETLRQRQADYRWFAARGYLVVSLEYSLASDERPTWNLALPQLGCALAWVGANAARYGGDPSKIALWGESAGGNLAINLSYSANRGTLEPSCEGAVPQVGATIALYPVVDPARMYRNPDLLIGRFGRLMTVNYTGGTPDEVPERYAAISSSTHIGRAAPPTLLIVPEADHLVVPEAAYAFASLARSAGVEVRLIRMPYAEHAFDLRSGSIGNQLVRQAMLRFLDSHGMKP